MYASIPKKMCLCKEYNAKIQKKCTFSVDNMCKRIYNTVIVVKKHISKGEKTMAAFRNLHSELARKNITNKKLAELLNISRNTLSNKLNLKSDFTLKEIKTIKSDLFNNQFSFDYLFKEML
jgi:DNA-binding NtrC family response regulator